MKLQLHSDLHLEMLGAYSIPKLDSDLIILAGDIDTGLYGLEWAEELTRTHQKPVMYVAGNHEYYREDIVELTREMREYAAQYDKLIFLEKDELVLDGVRFLGTTLWTNYFHDLGVVERDRNIDVLDGALNDHRIIKYASERFSAQRAYEENQKAEKWLRQKLDETFDGRTVVITHHAPSNKCNHREYGLSPFSSGFVSNYNALIKKATLWCYGHTHSNEDFMIGDCRVISNQAGYPHESVAGNQYETGLVIEV